MFNNGNEIKEEPTSVELEYLGCLIAVFRDAKCDVILCYEMTP